MGKKQGVKEKVAEVYDEIVKSLVKAKKNVSYSEIEADQGHDAFLMPSETYDSAIETFLEKNE